MKIGIAGAGGIGSNVARHLVQAGVTDLLVVDFDQVEISNLNRQFYTVSQAGRFKADCLKENLLAINPGAQIAATVARVEPGRAAGLFRDCAVVVEGFDDPLAKKALVEDLAGLCMPMVCASGIAGRDMDCVTIRKMGRCHVVGDFSTDAARAALFPPKIAMIAALMAGIVLDLTASAKTPSREG